MNGFDSGILLSSDFRKTFVSTFQREHDETEQIRISLLNFPDPHLNDQDKLLLAHSLSYTFITQFYDFQNGCLYENKSDFFRSENTFHSKPDYWLYMSFISYLYKDQIESVSISRNLNSQNISEIRSSFELNLHRKLSPFLYITFIHNLVDLIKSSSVIDFTAIEKEMAKQLILNSKELSQLPTFLDLYRKLFEKIQQIYQNEGQSITDEMEKIFIMFFWHSVNKTIVFPSEQFRDPNSRNVQEDISKILNLKIKVLEKMISQFKNEKDLISYHTFLFQRLSCMRINESWVYPIDEVDEHIQSQFSLSILSRKIGEIIGETIQPVGNTVVTISFAMETSINNDIIVLFSYNNHTYTKNIINNTCQVVFPCFDNVPLSITITYKSQTILTKKIRSLHEISNPIIKNVSINMTNYVVNIVYRYYEYDQTIDDLYVHLDMSPKNMLDFVLEAFIQHYLIINSTFYVILRNENELETNCIPQNISGLRFPVDYWLLLCDITIRYSIPFSYFFSRLIEKLDQCWSSSQAYIHLFCISLYNMYYAIKNMIHLEREERLLNDILDRLKDQCKILLMRQLAKPETYQHPSITSLMLIISLAYEDTQSTINIFNQIFRSSIHNSKQSIFSLLNYTKSENECTSMELYNEANKEIYNKNFNFQIGPNGLPLCNVDLISLRNSCDLILYRCKSISTFYLESFIPYFDPLSNFLNEFLQCSKFISSAFSNIDQFPDHKNLTYFIDSYNQLFKIFNNNSDLNPTIIFKDHIERWMITLSESMFMMTERSINFDNFRLNNNNNLKNSDSFYEIFFFFRQSYDLFTSLIFEENEIVDKLYFFLTFDSAMCSIYIEILLSLASKKIRTRSNKIVFPAWCPDLTGKRQLSFEQMLIVLNNIASFRKKWFEFIILFDSYIPNQPQISAANQALKLNESLSSNLLLIESNDDIINDPVNDQSKFVFKDPCYKLTRKINLMCKLLRLDLTYQIIDMLKDKMFKRGFFSILRIQKDFFTDSNINQILTDIYHLFTDLIQMVIDYLKVSLQIKCIPQLVRAIEDGIFECMVPFAFSKDTKMYLPLLLTHIKSLNNDVINFIESNFDVEIAEKCRNSFSLMPYIDSHIELPLKDVEDKLKEEKENGNLRNIITLNIILQYLSPHFCRENKMYTFISLD